MAKPQKHHENKQTQELYVISFMKCPERQIHKHSKHISSCLVLPWKHALTSHGPEGNFWVTENVLKLNCCCITTYLLKIGNLYIHNGWILWHVLVSYCYTTTDVSKVPK